MKFKLFSLAILAVFLFISSNSFAFDDDDIVHFPDPHFKKLLVNHHTYHMDSKLIDLNHDGEIQITEAEAFEGFLSLDYAKDSLTDITGIKAFIKLNKTFLKGCHGIKEMDFSGMPSLQEINLYNNPNLISLNMEGCVGIIKILCYQNGLRKLNVENCVNLENLDITDNMLSQINLKNCNNLKNIFITKNPITKINLEDCGKLNSLCLWKNSIIELDIRKCLVLERLVIGENKILNIDLTRTNQLKTISMSKNELSSLDVSELSKLETFRANDNNLEQLNIRNGNNKKIINFSAKGNSDLKCITVDDPEWSRENWTDVDEWIVFSEDCSNCVDEEEHFFNIYPNPANNSIVIDRINTDKSEVQIINMRGKIYKTQLVDYGQKHIKIDISNLANGTYIIDIDSNIEFLIVE